MACYERTLLLPRCIPRQHGGPDDPGHNPGSWSHIFPPLEHASWHGVTPTDLVFFFLFAVGNAMAFVMPRIEAAGEGHFWAKVIKRSLLIFSDRALPELVSLYQI